MNRSLLVLLGATGIILGCASVPWDNPYVLVPSKKLLQGHTAQDDKPLSDCEPEILPNGKMEYKCVVHFMADYDALKNKEAQLEAELKACQSGPGSP